MTKELRISQQTGCAPTIKIQMWNTTGILFSMQISEEEARELKRVLEKTGY